MYIWASLVKNMSPKTYKNRPHLVTLIGSNWSITAMGVRPINRSLSLDRLEFTYLRSERYFANQSSRKSFCCLRLVQTRVIICMRNLHQLGTFLLTAVSYALYLLILAYIGVHWFTLYKLHLFYAHV